MAKRKKTDEGSEDQNEAVDLISLLTPPGYEGLYEGEIVAPEPGEEFDLLTFAPENIPGQAVSADSPPPTTTAPDFTGNKPARLPSRDNQPPHLSSVPGNPRRQPITEKSSPPPAPPVALRPGNARLKPLPEIAGDTLEKIAAEISACDKCDLCKTRNKTVPGAGNPQARLVFIGEAPGAEEDASGIPFVGKAGQHLDKIITAAGFKRDQVFICNILKCRPPGNRDPQMPEMLACTPYLQRQLRLLNPSLIACLGNVAVKFVIGPDTPGITRVHGQWFTSIFGVPTMAMYHPSYLIRSESREKGSPNWQMWVDIQALKKRHDELG